MVRPENRYLIGPSIFFSIMAALLVWWLFFPPAFKFPVQITANRIDKQAIRAQIIAAGYTDPATITATLNTVVALCQADPVVVANLIEQNADDKASTALAIATMQVGCPVQAAKIQIVISNMSTTTTTTGAGS